MQNSHWNICESTIIKKKRKRKGRRVSCAQLLSDSDQLTVEGKVYKRGEFKICTFFRYYFQSKIVVIN